MRDPATGELDPLVYAPFTPKLMGLKGAYIERQLINYRDGRRAGGMSAMKHSMAPLFLTPRLLQAIGAYAPADCLQSVNFWEVFAQRVARMTAANALECEELCRIFAACAAWKRRTGGLSGAPARALGHMLRSVGGRLADPRSELHK